MFILFTISASVAAELRIYPIINLRLGEITGNYWQGQLQNHIFNKWYALLLLFAMLFKADDTMRREAEKMFEKTKKSIEQDVGIIREWIKSQPHLPEIMEDTKIANFLLLNKYSIEKTKKKIDMYYTMRNVFCDIFQDCNPKSPNMTELMNKNYCCALPRPFQGLYRMYFLKPKKLNDLMVREMGLQCINMYEVRLCEDCIVGDVVVFDFGTLTLNDVTKMTPILLSKLFSVYSVFSMRVKAVYVVNSPNYVSTILGIAKSILKPKIFARIQVCQDTAILQSTIPKEDLPKDYGGEGPSLDELNVMMAQTLERYQARYDLLDTLRVDESKRPQKLNNDEVLGFYGNFKQLRID